MGEKLKIFNGGMQMYHGAQKWSFAEATQLIDAVTIVYWNFKRNLEHPYRALVGLPSQLCS